MRLMTMPYAVVEEAERRVTSVLSTITATMAAARAAPSAIRMISQPAMPPAAAWAVGAGIGVEAPVGGSLTCSAAEAAGMTAADASRVQVTAARGGASCG